MNGLVSSLFVFITTAIASVLWVLLAPATAQETSANNSAAIDGSAQNCANTEVIYSDDQTLTVEERIARMDQSLTASLNQFDDCQIDESGGGEDTAAGNAAGAGAGGNDGTSNGNGSEPVASVSASDMQGSEPTPVAESDNSADQPIAGSGATGGLTLPNGKTPDDIPSSDNDSLLAAQIRKAAENEPDPEKRERLWAEYRKYRGIPQPE